MAGTTFVPATSSEGAFRGGRWRPGEPEIMPSSEAGFSWGTVGTALDYRLRYFFEVTPVENLVAHQGALRLGKFLGVREGLPRGYRELTEHLGRLLRAWPAAAAQSSDDDEVALARACFALAIYEQCFRGLIDDRWPIVQLSKGARVSKLLDMCSDVEAADIVAMARRFAASQGALIASAGRHLLNPTFAASRELGGADADLLVDDGLLLDIKATRKNTMSRRHLLQLLGYAFADWDDALGATRVGIYFARQGARIEWSLDELTRCSSSEEWTLERARREFRAVVEGITREIVERRRLRLTAFTIDDSPLDLSRYTPPGMALTYSAPPAPWRIRHPLPFRPSASGGAWHISVADCGDYFPAGVVEDPTRSPACGSRTVMLDPTSETFTPKRGSRNTTHQDRLCGNCLRVTRTPRS
jgi:hypothetical protein